MNISYIRATLNVDLEGIARKYVQSKDYWTSDKSLKRRGRKVPEPTQEPIRRYIADGYVSLSGMWNHPLASPQNGVVREHRLVLWNSLGCESIDCEHECNWCGVTLTWGGIHGILSDHLNFDKLNNDISNLVVSCFRCNITTRSVNGQRRYHKPIQPTCMANGTASE